MEHGRAFEAISVAFQWSMVLLILLNLLFLLPIVTQHVGFLTVPLTFLTTALFTVEYLVRVWVCIESPEEAKAEKSNLQAMVIILPSISEASLMI